MLCGKSLAGMEDHVPPCLSSPQLPILWVLVRGGLVLEKGREHRVIFLCGYVVAGSLVLAFVWEELWSCGPGARCVQEGGDLGC